uniref:Uncharacterized protein n=1 Tax=Anguilla anguilla TaxID=7936 RepID=A0A0E9S7P9_ANGAN
MYAIALACYWVTSLDGF